MSDMKDYLWLVKTNKGDFFITVAGNWTQGEAAKKIWLVFDWMKIDILAMIPRKRASGPDDAVGTIYPTEEPKDGRDFEFLAGKKLFEACDRGIEFEFEMVRLKKQMEL